MDRLAPGGGASCGVIRGGDMTQRLIRRREVEQLTGLTRSTLYELVAKGKFPKPVPISAQAVAWVESEVADWQQRCIAQRDTRAAADSAFR